MRREREPLTDAAIAVPESVAGVLEEKAHRSRAEVPVTYVPFRNAHFLAAAASWAEVLGAKRVVIGPVEQDSSGYPDCRPAYYGAGKSSDCRQTREGRIQVEHP